MAQSSQCVVVQIKAGEHRTAEQWEGLHFSFASPSVETTFTFGVQRPLPFEMVHLGLAVCWSHLVNSVRLHLFILIPSGLAERNICNILLNFTLVHSWDLYLSEKPENLSLLVIWLYMGRYHQWLLWWGNKEIFLHGINREATENS